MTDTKPTPLPIEVFKPTPYTFDLGLLLANDPNPLLLHGSETLEADLAATARDGAQALLNQLLSTCPIASTPNGVLLSLPGVETRLPREKPLPPPTAQTTWQKFAAKKGIKPKSAATRQNLQYNEATGEWEEKWGYKGANKAVEQQWIVEVDEKGERERREKARMGKLGKSAKQDGGMGAERTVQGVSRAERKERVRRNERAQRKNERKGRKSGN